MIDRARSTIIALLITHVFAGAAAYGERIPSSEADAVGAEAIRADAKRNNAEGTTARTVLDHIAFAVDGAESSHGRDRAMWRLNPSGPQGPMQVSEAASTDVGGGDRFDLSENRRIGRLYLGQLYRHFRNWPDAIAAYNWGRANVDTWIKAGRPTHKLLAGVAVYVSRVLDESGVCVRRQPEDFSRLGEMTNVLNSPTVGRDIVTRSVCARLDSGSTEFGGKDGHLYRDQLSIHHSYVMAASLVADRRDPKHPSSVFEQEAASSRLSWMAAARRLGCSTPLEGALQCRQDR